MNEPNPLLRSRFILIISLTIVSFVGGILLTPFILFNLLAILPAVMAIRDLKRIRLGLMVKSDEKKLRFSLFFNLLSIVILILFYIIAIILLIVFYSSISEWFQMILHHLKGLL